MNFSAYLEGQIANFMKGIAIDAPPSGLLLALSTADPTDTGGGIAEPPGANGYARKAILFGAHVQTPGIGSQMSGPTLDLVFTATALWGIITHWAIFRSDGGGEMMWHGAVSVPKNIQAGDSFVCNLGALSLTIR
jgi:hypothetical protein